MLAEGRTAPTTTTTPATTTATAAPAERGNPAKWVVLGVGVGALAGGGALAGLAYSGAQTALTDNDEAAYESQRTLNKLGFGIAGVGIIATAVGIVIPSHRPAVVSVLPLPTGAALALSTTW